MPMDSKEPVWQKVALLGLREVVRKHPNLLHALAENMRADAIDDLENLGRFVDSAQGTVQQHAEAKLKLADILDMFQVAVITGE